MKKVFYLLLWSVFVLAFLFMRFDTPIPVSTVHRKILNNSTTEYKLEIDEILNITPFLWRPTSLTHDTVGSRDWDRIEEQRLWVKRLANTTYLRNAKTKTLFVEYPQDYVRIPENDVCKGFVSGWENKCLIIWAQEQESNFLQKELEQVLQNTTVDAVVTVRNTHSRSNYKLPPSLRQIMYLKEAPHKSIGAELSFNDAILASYDLTVSDIPSPYFEYVPTMDNVWGELFPPHKTLDLKSKTKLAVALISNCKSKMRLDIVKELQEYMELDVFGRCGETMENCYSNDTKSKNECTEWLAKEYKFFLAFENANCRHYITEKFFLNALTYGMVPIVIGAHPEDYRLVAPPHSYIHAESFGSLKDLAEYINNMDDSEYESYFAWRNKGIISRAPTKDVFCRICGMLYYSDFVPPRSWRTLEKITTWADIHQCLPNDKWKWLAN